MGQFQKCILMFLSVTTLHAAADVGLNLGTGGFQGALSAAAVFDWRQTHSVELGLGQYTLNNGHGMQINLGYRYNPFHVDFGDVKWSPTGIGLVALYALDQDDYFTESPGKYPSEGYYEQTGIRLGLEWSTQIAAWDGKFRVLYKVVLMDSGVIGLLNNDGKYAEYFFSSGLSLQYFFK